ncbi:MAG: ABC transporter ATP-binding protein [bacterium]|nr:ABC transporter ATP-binding protein [bacterium]
MKTSGPDLAPLLRVEGAQVHFRTTRFGRRRTVQAVRGVNLEIVSQETVALVGESGSGKTTLARAIMGLDPLHAGSIMLDQQRIDNLKGAALRSLRSKLQMVFQDPYSSLNPSLSVGASVAEPIRNFFGYSGKKLDSAVEELFERVGLLAEHRHRYPHEFSGGQRQRIAIARALAVQPQLVICDEAVSALDVSTQNQILSLLGDLQRDLGVAFLFVTHDLSVVWHIAHKVAVMYLGELVEFGPVDDVLLNPSHPYTQSLIAAVPVPDPQLARQQHRATIAGEVPDPANPPSGCSFASRCPHSISRCSQESPDWDFVQTPNWRVRCYLHNEL